MGLVEVIHEKMGDRWWSVTGLLAMYNIPAEAFPPEVRRELDKGDDAGAARQLAPWLARQPAGALRLERNKPKGYATLWRVVAG